MYVCSPTNQLADVRTLLEIVARYKQLGGRLPAGVEVALEGAKAGTNAEDSMNIACEGLFKFYVSENARCAREAGYSSLEQYYADRKTNPDGDRVFKQEACLLNVERQWQLTNINYTINPYIPDSALRVFLRKTANQVFGIVSKYLKKRILQGSPPAGDK
jgi:hypothetical protein